jgi:hypothetical protein
VAVDAGDLPAARDACTASLAIAQRLADADPGNAGWSTPTPATPAGSATCPSAR